MTDDPNTAEQPDSGHILPEQTWAKIRQQAGDPDADPPQFSEPATTTETPEFGEPEKLTDTPDFGEPVELDDEPQFSEPEPSQDGFEDAE